jgi:hypothetical protein
VDSDSQALAEALQSSFSIVKYVMVGLFVLFLFSGMFKVEPQEKAIILRFGKPVGEGEQALLSSGLHWSWPYPIDEVIKIPISEIQKATTKTAWFLQSPEQEALNQDPPPGPSLNPAIDGYALTGDGNIVHAQATLSYRIEDPVRCVFEFAGNTGSGFSLAGVSNAVVNALDNALANPDPALPCAVPPPAGRRYHLMRTASVPQWLPNILWYASRISLGETRYGSRAGPTTNKGFQLVNVWKNYSNINVIAGFSTLRILPRRPGSPVTRRARGRSPARPPARPLPRPYCTGRRRRGRWR